MVMVGKNIENIENIENNMARCWVNDEWLDDGTIGLDDGTIGLDDGDWIGWWGLDDGNGEWMEWIGMDWIGWWQ